MTRILVVKLKLKSGINNNQTLRGKMDINNNNWGINFATKNISLSPFDYFEHYFDDAVRNNEIIILNDATIPKESLRVRDQKKLDKWYELWKSGVYKRD